MSTARQAVPRIEMQGPRIVVPWRALLRWIAFAAILGGFATAVLGLLDSLGDRDRYPVRRVAVDGPLQYTERRALEDVITRYSDTGFYQADLAGLQQSLTQLPWVKRVAIRKVWPDQLRVRLLEHSPVALWGESQILSSELVAFEPNPMDYERVASALRLPYLNGPDGSRDEVWRHYARWQEQLVEQGLTIARIERDRRGGWRIQLESGPLVLLGTSDVDARLERWLRIQGGTAALDLALIARIDLRYTNGFSVAWKPQTGQQG